MSKVEVITSTERRRKWSDSQKKRILEEVARSGNLSKVAKLHNLPPSQVFMWRKQQNQTTRMSTPMIQKNDCNQNKADVWQIQVKRLEQMLGRKTMELEILRETLAEYVSNPERRTNLMDRLAGSHSEHL